MLTTATFFLIRQVKLGRSKESNGQNEATCGSAVAYLQEVGVSAFPVIGVGGGGVSDCSVSSRAGDLAISRPAFCTRSLNNFAVQPRGSGIGASGGGGAGTQAPSSRRFHAQWRSGTGWDVAAVTATARFVKRRDKSPCAGSAAWALAASCLANNTARTDSICINVRFSGGRSIAATPRVANAAGDAYSV